MIDTTNLDEQYEKTPRELAQDRLNISQEYGVIGRKMVDLKHIKALWWKAMRKDFKSDASTEREWDLTTEGQEMEEIRMKMKGMEMQMSAIKTMLTVCADEAHNSY